MFSKRVEGYKTCVRTHFFKCKDSLQGILHHSLQSLESSPLSDLPVFFSYQQML